MAKEYNLKNINGNVPKNGGQILIEFARCNNVDVNSYNIRRRIASRDFSRRIRRAKKANHFFEK